MPLTQQEFERLKFLTLEQQRLGGPPAAPRRSLGGKLMNAFGNLRGGFETGFGEESELVEGLERSQDRFSQVETPGDFLSAQGQLITTGLTQGAQGSVESLFGGGISATASLLPEDVKRVGGKKLEDILLKERGFLGGETFAERLSEESMNESIIDRLDMIGKKIDPNDPNDLQLVDNIRAGSLTVLDFLSFGGIGRILSAANKAKTSVITSAKNIVPKGLKNTLRNKATSGALVPQGIKDLKGKKFPETLEEYQNSLASDFKKSFFDTNKANTKALEAEARRQSFDGVKQTQDSLVDNLVKQLAFPVSQKGLANFNKAIEIIETLQTTSQEVLLPYLKTIPDLTDGITLRKAILNRLNNNPEILGKNISFRESFKFFDDLEGFEKMKEPSFRAEDLHQISKDANRISNAYKASGDAFKADVAHVIGNVARELLDKMDLTQAVRRANKEYARLQGVRDTVRIIEFDKIKIDPFVEAIGRLGGITGLGAGMTALALGSPVVGGGLLIAAAFAKMGGDVLVSFLQNRRFSAGYKDMIVEGVQKLGVVDEIIARTKDAENARFLRKTFQKPEDTPVIAGPKSVDETARLEPAASFSPAPVDPTTGKYFKAWKSVTEAENISAQVARMKSLREQIKADLKAGDDINRVVKQLEEAGMPRKQAQDLVGKVSNEITFNAGPIPKAKGGTPETTKSSLKKVPKEHAAYHAGDLGIGKDTTFGNMVGWNRSTGHFGTGTYFVSSPKLILESRAGRPVKEVSFEGLNMYKPKNTKVGNDLHDALRDLNRKFNDDLSDTDRLILSSNLSSGLGFAHSSAKINKALDTAFKKSRIIQRLSLKAKNSKDSPSTIFMKELGYDGVDVRGLDGKGTGYGSGWDLDNTGYGSVVYDVSKLKN